VVLPSQEHVDGLVLMLELHDKHMSTGDMGVFDTARWDKSDDEDIVKLGGYLVVQRTRVGKYGLFARLF